MKTLQLPFAHDVIGFIEVDDAPGRAYVAVRRVTDNPFNPVCSTHDVDTTTGFCYSGHYDMTTHEALVDMVERATVSGVLWARTRIDA